LHSKPSARKLTAGKTFIAAFLRDCEAGGEALSQTFRSPPTCSVHHGAAGIALLLYKLGYDRDDRFLLSSAERWVRRTSRHVASPEAFYNPAPAWDITEKSVGRMSLLFCESGVRCVQALIALGLGRQRAARSAVALFLRLSEIAERRHELTIGKGGMLLGCALLLDSLPNSARQSRKQVRARGEQIYRQMIKLPTAGPALPVKRLGIAHGRAGILYALLLWHDATGRPVSPRLSAALKKLAEMGQEIGSAARWEHTQGKGEYWSGWCNGTAGYVFLWTLTARLLSHPGYLELAEMAAQHTWQVGSANLSLCCGAIGDGYAYLNLYRATGKALWLQRARSSARLAMGVEDHSLYRGRAGVVALLSDLDHPKTSWMPFFERTRHSP
jgi:serine/threonine-protein kinase